MLRIPPILPVVGALLLPLKAVQDPPPPKVPDLGGDALVEGLLGTPGCLGVETAFTQSGKSVIFAWFKDRASTVDWYFSETHQGAIASFMDSGESGDHEPLAHVAEDAGPILCVASLTMSQDRKEHVPGIHMPIRQIAIELYAPVPGGIAVGGRFAPDSVEVAHMKVFQLEEGLATPSRDTKGSGN